jgi:hypothetical protein
MEILEALFESAEFDYKEIKTFTLEKELFNDREKSRIINSFIFNISKIQDNLGAKFFKEILIELREIDNFSTPMIDVIHQLEKLHIIDSLKEWDTLREIRNALTHDYSMDFDDRVENLKRAIWAYSELKMIFTKIRSYLIKTGF